MDYSALATAGASLLGSAFSSAQSVSEAQKNRAFQERMSSTAHQREVEDLKAAHLNPILSAKYGGSSTPGGSTPQIQDYGKAASDYTSAKQTSQQTALIQANTRKVNADAAVSEQTAKNLAVTSPFLNQFPQTELGLKQNELFKSDAMTSNPALRAMVQQLINSALESSYNLPAAKNQAEMNKTWFGRTILPYINSALHGSQILHNVK